MGRPEGASGGATPTRSGLPAAWDCRFGGAPASQAGSCSTRGDRRVSDAVAVAHCDAKRQGWRDGWLTDSERARLRPAPTDGADPILADGPAQPAAVGPWAQRLATRALPTRKRKPRRGPLCAEAGDDGRH